MPKIQQYSRQQGAPQSLGLRPQKPRTAGAEARQRALSEIEDYADEQFERDLKSEIVDAETDFQEQARERMLEMKQLKGENAVSNEATGRSGVYEKSRSSLNELQKDFQDRVPQGYQHLLDKRLEKVSQSWLDNASRWEEKERQNLQEYRADKATTAEVNHVQATDGDPEELKRSMKRTSERLKGLYGDNYYAQAKIREAKHSETKTAILSALNANNVERARQHLQDHKDLFGEEEVQTFQKMIDDTELKQQVKQYTDRLSGLPYETQLSEIQEIEDERVREHVYNQVRGEKAIEDAREKERQSKRFQDLWEQTVMARHQPDQHDMPKVQEILDDPLLSISQKSRLMNTIGGQKDTEDQRRAQNRYWYDFHSRINSGRNVPSRTEIMTASADGKITPGMERSLLRELDDGTSFPSLGKAKDHLRHQLRNKSNIIDSDEEWKDFQRDLEVWAYQHQQETGKNPSYEQIIQFGEALAEEPKDKSWWPFYTGTPDAPYERDELPHYRQMIRPEGVPEDAQWDADAGAYVFKRDGDTYAMVPQGNNVRTFRRRGEQQGQE